MSFCFFLLIFPSGLRAASCSCFVFFSSFILSLISHLLLFFTSTRNLFYCCDLFILIQSVSKRIVMLLQSSQSSSFHIDEDLSGGNNFQSFQSEWIFWNHNFLSLLSILHFFSSSILAHAAASRPHFVFFTFFILSLISSTTLFLLNKKKTLFYCYDLFI